MTDVEAPSTAQSLDLATSTTSTSISDDTLIEKPLSPQQHQNQNQNQQERPSLQQNQQQFSMQQNQSSQSNQQFSLKDEKRSGGSGDYASTSSSEVSGASVDDLRDDAYERKPWSENQRGMRSGSGSGSGKLQKRHQYEQQDYDDGSEYFSQWGRLRPLIMWEKPSHSAATMLGSLATIYLITNYPITQLVGIAGMTLLAINFTWTYGFMILSSFFGKDIRHPARRLYEPGRVLLTKDSAIDFIFQHQPQINSFLIEGAKVAFVEDWARSAKYFLGFYLTYLFGRFISTSALMYSLVFCLLTLPVVYARNHSVIDKEIDNLSSIVESQMAIINLKVRELYVRAMDFINYRLRGSIDETIADTAARMQATKQKMEKFVREHDFHAKKEYEMKEE